MDLPSPAPLAEHWTLDPGIVFLNHGSFGACPRAVLEHQHELRRRLEAEPVRFFVRELPELLARARHALAAFVGADAEGLAFVTNATTGVNTVLHSLPLQAGDQLLVTDHEYNACRNALDAAAARTGAEVVVVPLPFPGATPEGVVEAVLGAVGPRTRLLLVDHVSSPTGLVLPVAELVRELEGRGVAVLVDGAHAPGMLALELDELGASFYTGNCHKWLCAPKGAAFLWVREDWRERVRPLVISHGANAPLVKQSRFRLEFDWVGTDDPTAFLSVERALEVMAAMVPDGWPEIRARNRGLALEGRRVLGSALHIEDPCPESMIGSLAALPLPDGGAGPPRSAFAVDPLQNRLFEQWSIEVPVIPWPAPPRRLLRLSAQLYNSREQVDYLAQALRQLI